MEYLHNKIYSSRITYRTFISRRNFDDNVSYATWGMITNFLENINNSSGLDPKKIWMRIGFDTGALVF